MSKMAAVLLLIFMASLPAQEVRVYGTDDDDYTREVKWELSRRHIPFIYYDIDADSEKSREMWDLLRRAGHGNEVLLPVIRVGERVFPKGYDHLETVIALASSFKREPVLIYGPADDEACRRAVQRFTAEGIPFRFLDVTAEAAHEREMMTQLADAGYENRPVRPPALLLDGAFWEDALTLFYEIESEIRQARSVTLFAYGDHRTTPDIRKRLQSSGIRYKFCDLNREECLSAMFEVRVRSGLSLLLSYPVMVAGGRVYNDGLNPLDDIVDMMKAAPVEEKKENPVVPLTGDALYRIRQLVNAFCPAGKVLWDEFDSLPTSFRIGRVNLTLGGMDVASYLDGYSDDEAGTYVNTAVHEICHAVSSRAAWQAVEDEEIPFDVDDHFNSFLMEDRRRILVTGTPVFITRQANASFPGELKTNRYATYFSPSHPEMSSQAQGVYGLLDEFHAYYHGTKAALDLYDYYEPRCRENPKLWLEYLDGMHSTLQAHGEFKLYILHYLVHAQKHHPEIYRQIMGNAPFVTAFLSLDSDFTRLALDYRQIKETILEKVRPTGLTVKEKDDFIWIGLEGRKTFMKSYLALLKRCERAPYKYIMENIKRSHKKEF